jgi:hypothetical protein
LPGAIECLDRLLQFASDNLAALIEKGALLHRAGKTGSSVECFGAACRIAPEAELALTNLAVAVGDSGHRHETVVEFRRILQRYPKNPHVRHRLRRSTSLIVPFLHIRKHDAELRKIVISVLEDGEAVGVVQWTDLDLMDGIRFCDHPDDYVDGGWLQVLHTFPQPIVATRGEQLELMVGHGRASLIVTPAARYLRKPPSGLGLEVAQQ